MNNLILSGSPWGYGSLVPVGPLATVVACVLAVAVVVVAGVVAAVAGVVVTSIVVVGSLCPHLNLLQIGCSGRFLHISAPMSQILSLTLDGPSVGLPTPRD